MCKVQLTVRGRWKQMARFMCLPSCSSGASLIRKKLAIVGLAAIAALLATSSSLSASGVFNGTSYLEVDESVVGNSTEPDYGVLVAWWFKRSDTGNSNRMFLCISNNSSGTSRRSLNIGHANQFIRAETYNGSGAAVDTSNSYSADQWNPAFAWFGASDNRAAKLDSGSWNSNGISRPNVSGLSRTAIGTLWVNGGPNTVFSYSGKLAEIGVWSNINSTDRDAIVTKYLKGVRPPNVPAPSGSLKVYQPLRTAANEFDKVGPTFNNTSGVTYDATDHPPVIYTARQLHHSRQR